MFLGLLLSMQVDIGKQINTKNQICLNMSDAWPGSESCLSHKFFTLTEKNVERLKKNGKEKVLLNKEKKDYKKKKN